MPPRRDQAAREEDVPTSAELARTLRQLAQLTQQRQWEINGRGKKRSEEDHSQGEKRPKYSNPNQNRNYQGKGGPRNHNGHQNQRNSKVLQLQQDGASSIRVLRQEGREYFWTKSEQEWRW
nr:hypothetical protein Iba_chr12dCG8720 [Ipomoea batatas]